LLWWKGVDLAIGAMARLPDWRLIVCGAGPDESRLRRWTAELGVVERTVFTGWLPRSELLRLMREEAGVFLFPSLHDEAGWVVTEALAADLPVVCLDRGGPPLLAEGHGVGVSTSGSRGTVMSRLATEVERARTVPLGASRDGARRYLIDRRARDLAAIAGTMSNSIGVPWSVPDDV
jgi:glycosyltransferase involved in cell wall biosynthesis